MTDFNDNTSANVNEQSEASEESQAELYTYDGTPEEDGPTLPQPEPQAESMAETIAKLQAENDALRKAKTKVTDGVLTLKVSQKGAVSIYGVGRWPVTLYASQAVTFFNGCKGGLADRIHRFILDNQSKGLEFKDDTKASIVAACEAALAVKS